MALSDNEIIKALERCKKSDATGRCDGCSLWSKQNCMQYLFQKTLDLINRQKAEKEALINGQETLQKYMAEQKAEIRKYKNCYEQVKWERDLFEEQCKTAKAEINAEILNEYKARIQVEEMVVCADSLGEWLEFLDEFKLEAIKEFAERLKAVSVRFHITHEHLDKFVPFIDDVDIDNLVKEMVGDNDESTKKS